MHTTRKSAAKLQKFWDIAALSLHFFAKIIEKGEKVAFF